MSLNLNIANFETISGANAVGEPLQWSGGEKTMAIYSNHDTVNKWDGGTVSIQASLSLGTAGFITLTDGEGADLTFTEDTLFKLNIGKCRIRFVLTGANGTASDLIIKVS